MARKRSPIVSKALDFIAISLTPMAKVRRPIARKLLLLRRTKRPFNHLLRYHSYDFISEYQFSPSNSPLFRSPPKRRGLFLALLCGGDGAESVFDGGASHDELEMLSSDRDVGGEFEFVGCGDEGDAGVDARAERFIEKFYEEIRIQRRARCGPRAGPVD